MPTLKNEISSLVDRHLKDPMKSILVTTQILKAVKDKLPNVCASNQADRDLCFNGGYCDGFNECLDEITHLLD